MVDSVLGGILTDALSGAIALLIGSTALLGGAARYAAVLAQRTEREVEQATAFGFFFGIGLGVFALAMDSLA